MDQESTQNIFNLLKMAVAIIVPVFIVLVIILPQAVRILREYERGVVFRLGKLQDAKGPGVVFLIPIIDKIVRMDLRVVTIDVAKQEVMTKDNVPRHGGCRGLFSRGQSHRCRRESGELLPGDLADRADNHAQRPGPGVP